MRLKSRKDYRRRRHMRGRKKIRGTVERPRMAIMVSNRYMYVQFIDDDKAITVASASTLAGNGGNNIATARLLGQRAAECARDKGIRDVVVDCAGFKFHGRIKAIVDAVMETGLAPGTNTSLGAERVNK